MPAKRKWERTLTTPPDRRPPAPERDVAGRVTTHEAAVALARMKGPELKAHIGIKVDACEGFQPYNRQRQRWTRHRLRELGQMFGDLSAGVGARVRSAAWGYAFGEWAAARAAQCGDAGLANLALSILQKASAEDTKALELADAERRMRKDTAKPQTLGEVLNVEGHGNG